MVKFKLIFRNYLFLRAFLENLLGRQVILKKKKTLITKIDFSHFLFTLFFSIL